MTLSLLHVQPATGTVAVLTATGGVAVGGYVHHAWRGLGACATQGLATNPWYPEGVRHALEQGHTAQTALEQVTRQDDGAARRQCLVMDAGGRAAVHSGSENRPLVAAELRPTVAAAGNLLADATVVEILLRRFLTLTCSNPDAVWAQGAAPRYRDAYETHLPETLIEALEAALQAGGDSRGTRSAALRVESFDAAPIDLRVDWDDDPAGALRALARRVREPAFAAFLASLPTK
ncbi:DUF1028 domain-containing protein [Halomonas sp. MCCC 1A17488]|uniref:DUF1028 domain-containing protein n=1 Tax=unclassified Halomonas TaxID=2609666 RepID=UPI0018D22565|nr:DUF1028 domain-containing protein [Halomonas sp. SS10-MC5]MCE8017745.1 DUF1028 domain-containing protein [Halomonas sp. MCCC 1A17488]MCG3241078.1 DUF1028 domain-containing protein [Halomonas sp. MCCC 1A17488]QPP48938.1 DUF1028 domain-containing protein [Halomonas sp. SS10-MC5]